MGCDVPFGSLAAPLVNISLMAASEGKADVFRFNFGSLRLNVRFHQKRSFRSGEMYRFDGPLSAKSGLDSAATDDQPKLFAYALGNGRLLWEKNLPAPSQATPMTYSSNGQQFVVVTAGGEDAHSGKPGDYIIAFSVP